MKEIPDSQIQVLKELYLRGLNKKIPENRLKTRMTDIIVDKWKVARCRAKVFVEEIAKVEYKSDIILKIKDRWHFEINKRIQ